MQRIFLSRLMSRKSPIWLIYYGFMGLIKVFRSANNPFRTLIFLLGFFEEFELDLRYIGKINVSKEDIDNNFVQTLISACSNDLNCSQQTRLRSIITQRFDNIIEVDGIKIKNTMPLFILIEIFVLEDYKFHELDRGDVVIDLGASVGDSSLYLAKEGYVVYAFEPLPQIFEIGRENIKMNPQLASKINYINKAVSCKKGVLKMGYDGVEKSHYSSLYTEKNKMVSVDTITIDEIVSKINSKPKGLKVDCEGCEYEIMDNLDLSGFREIIIEYHPQPKNRDPREIVDKLRSEGFTIKLRGNHSIGLIHARRT
ncbi:FkbM family methyltransferase [Methanothermobacter sp.]|uniref:FkbM family methyltransferase n=1 Tax=Methanothermobacter sp. TaxID=1884223 RepID=UPI002615B789|nr:FkbM family methyltransferase [Methanothermobacter sp.]MDI9617678.1 FkbM family methyltransferase [Methanothermobacter sp.]